MTGADVGVFLHPRTAPLVPDAFLSLDVQELQQAWGKEGRSYFIWEYKKPPDVVIEVVSNEKGGEVAAKMPGYAGFGIPFYVIFDPLRLVQDELVRAYRLGASGEYSPCGYDPLPGIGLGLRLWRGWFDGLLETWLRWTDWTDASGALVLQGEERAVQEGGRADRAESRVEQERDRADSAESRAEQERDRAEQERDRAEQERDRADSAESRAEQERDRADSAESRAEQERDRAKQERGRAEQERDRAEQERDRAEQERDRADSAESRAEQERIKAARLAALLRAHGISPDNGGGE